MDDQVTVFDDVQSLIQSAVDGYNVCIWAYGQTGSGKTYTMIGDDKNPGIAPRAFDKIFQIIQDNSDKWEYSVSAFMLELYQDKLIDLFKKQANESKLDIKKDRDGFVHVPGASMKPVKTASDLRKLFDEGAKIRHKGTTNMNFESSRSHLILSILIESRSKLSGTTLRGKVT